MGKAGAIASGALCLYVLLSLMKRHKRAMDEEARAKRLALCERNGYKVAICGAGFSGLCLAIKLKQSGIPFVIFDREESFGGTWLKNIYPGAACDIPSCWYSYSFEYSWDWTRKWPRQEEILDYINKVAQKYDIPACAQFGTKVERAVFDRTSSTWSITVRDVATGAVRTETSNVFISAVGQLDEPSKPDIPGLDSFKGVQVHTAKWTKDIDTAGKSVVGVGTGPSAVQAYPEIAKECKTLTVVQRSPTWVMQRGDFAYSGVTRWLHRTFPFIWLVRRLSFYLYAETVFHMLIKMSSTIYSNKLFQKYIGYLMKTDMGSKRAELEEKLIPHDPIGAKRLVVSSDWVPMFTRENVHLETTTVSEIKQHSVVLSNGNEVPCDVLVFATGFKTTRFLSTLQVSVNSENTLDQTWDGVPGAYKSMAVHGFPNFWMMYGPGSNLGHGSIIFMSECEAEYITRHIQRMVDENIASITVKKDSYDADVADLRTRLKQTVFADPNVHNWYKLDSGEVVNNWSSSCFEFQLHLGHDDIGEYHTVYR